MGGIWPNKKSEETPAGKENKVVAKHQVTVNPFVLKRVSSMYFDEDGDLAHEFYEEHRTQSSQGVVRWTMRLLQHNGIRPQGEVELPIPRLHVDLPIVLMDNV